MTDDDFTPPDDSSPTGSYEAQREAVMKSFEDKDFAKEAFRKERERLGNIRDEADKIVKPEDESDYQMEIRGIVNDAVEQIKSLDEAEPIINSDINAAGKAYIKARQKRIALVGLLASLKVIDR